MSQTSAYTHYTAVKNKMMMTAVPVRIAYDVGIQSFCYQKIFCRFDDVDEYDYCMMRACTI